MSAENNDKSSAAEDSVDVTRPEGNKKTINRPKSNLRLLLEALEPGQTIHVTYSQKTPFAVTIAIKRYQLKKHFVFSEIAPNVFDIWVGSKGDRSTSLKPVTSFKPPLEQGQQLVP